jgi:hypothetical protein
MPNEDQSKGNKIEANDVQSVVECRIARSNGD